MESNGENVDLSAKLITTIMSEDGTYVDIEEGNFDCFSSGNCTKSVSNGTCDSSSNTTRGVTTDELLSHCSSSCRQEKPGTDSDFVSLHSTAKSNESRQHGHNSCLTYAQSQLGCCQKKESSMATGKASVIDTKSSGPICGHRNNLSSNDSGRCTSGSSTKRLQEHQDSCDSTVKLKATSSCCNKEEVSRACGKSSYPDKDKDNDLYSNAASCAIQKKNVTPTCVAVLSRDGSKVSIYDSSGAVRTFAVDGFMNDSNNSKKLCFSSHGVPHVDEYLSPCFNADGLHGDPEEGCFCGIDEAHLHAHPYDEKMCGDGDRTSQLKRTMSDKDLMQLAKITLHKVEEVDEEGGQILETKATLTALKSEIGTQKRLRHCNSMPASPSLPAICNSREIAQSIKEYGLDVKYPSTDRERIFQVKHEDHTDYLVHHHKTGNLHLEHACDACGDVDLHGKLQLVSTRAWNPDGAKDETDTFHTHESHSLEEASHPHNLNKRLRLHFYEIPQVPMTVLDMLSDLFTMESSRVSIVRNCCDAGICSGAPSHGFVHKTASSSISRPVSMLPCRSNEQSKTCVSESVTSTDMNEGSSPDVVRSKFFVKQICCASEIPAINTILRPIAGISNISVNTTIKIVTIDHDPSKCTAQEIADKLNREKFGATITFDGNQKVQAKKGIATEGMSEFHLPSIDVKIPENNMTLFLKAIEGIKEVSFDVQTKKLFVIHDLNTSAQHIQASLSQKGWIASITKDAAQTAKTTPLTQSIMATYVESTFLVQGQLDNVIGSEIEAIFRQEDKKRVTHIEIELCSNTIKVDHNPQILSTAEILTMLQDGGLDVTVLIDGFVEGVWTTAESIDEIEEHKVSLQWPIIASGIFWIISMLSLIGGKWDYLKYVALLSVALGMPKIALKALRTLRRCLFDANCMMLFAVVGAIALQEFIEAAAVAFLFSISDWLETICTSRARNALSAIVKLRPERAKVQDPVTTRFVVVPASSLRVGHIVMVSTGDKIPCDGIVLEGRSAVNESSLTGEARPVPKKPGDHVSGGTINTGKAQLLVKATSTSDDSAVSRLIRLVEEAQSNRSPTENFIDAFAKRYTPVVVLAALLMCTIPWAFGRETGIKWTNIGLVTIVIACPCALIISTPVTYVAGIAAAAQRGIVVKGGVHLEALGRVKMVALDKTGTITEGTFGMLNLRVIGDAFSREEVLKYLSAVESRSNHPIAAALVSAAVHEGIRAVDDLKVEDHCDLDGEGVFSKVNTSDVYIGNSRLFKRIGLIEHLPESIATETQEWASTGGTIGFISIAPHGLVGTFCVADTIRSEARAVIKTLQEMGIRVNMLTGDSKNAALAIGGRVGLCSENIVSQLLPTEKLDLIKLYIEETEKEVRGQNCLSLKRRGFVMMCGDGVNDAPALAAADVGVAMGAGAALAMETADVTLLDSNLEKLLKSIRLGQRVMRTIVQNVTFSLIAKAVVMGLTFAGYTALWFAIASDVGTMLIVTLNGMKLLPSTKSVRTQSGFEVSRIGFGKDMVRSRLAAKKAQAPKPLEKNIVEQAV